MSDDNGTATLEHHQAPQRTSTAGTQIMDAELAAMQTITTAIQDLDEATRGRVLGWVNGRWPEGSSPSTPPRGKR